MPASNVSPCTIRVKLWLSTRIQGMIRKEYKTCLNNFQSTPSLEELAQPTNTTEPTKQCVVLMGKPILVASRTVNAAPSSIVKPLEVKQVNYTSLSCNISTSWGKKLKICLHLVMRFSKHKHQKKKPTDFSDTRSTHGHTTYVTEGHRM